MPTALGPRGGAPAGGPPTATLPTPLLNQPAPTPHPVCRPPRTPPSPNLQPHPPPVLCSLGGPYVCLQRWALGGGAPAGGPPTAALPTPRHPNWQPARTTPLCPAISYSGTLPPQSSHTPPLHFTKSLEGPPLTTPPSPTFLSTFTLLATLSAGQRTHAASPLFRRSKGSKKGGYRHLRNQVSWDPQCFYASLPTMLREKKQATPEPLTPRGSRDTAFFVSRGL